MKMFGNTKAFIGQRKNHWKIPCLYLHLNSQIFPINSNADAEGILLHDWNADSAFGKLLNSNSDYDSAKVRMHSIMNADSNSDPKPAAIIRTLASAMTEPVLKQGLQAVFKELQLLTFFPSLE